MSEEGEWRTKWKTLFNKRKRRANELITEGSKFYRSSQYEEALLRYKKALKLYPQSTMLPKHIGDSYHEFKQYSNAINYYKQALEINPNFRAARLSLAYCYYYTKKPKDSIKEFEILIKESPDDFEVYRFFGFALIDDVQYDRAIEIYKIAQRISPNSPSPVKNIGLVLFRLNQFDEAILQFNLALKMNPKYVDAYYYLAQLYSVLFNFEKSLELLNHAIEIAPNDETLYVELGFVMTEMGKYEDALENFQKGLNLVPNNSDSLCGLGCLYRSLKKYDKSTEYFKKMTESPLGVKEDAYLSWAHTLIKQGDLAQALEFTEKGLEIDNIRDRGLFYKGLINYKLCNYDAAIENFQGSLKSYLRGHRKCTLHYYYAMTLWKKYKDDFLPHLSEIMKEFSNSLDLKVANSKVYFRRAKINLELSPDEAKSDLLKALEYIDQCHPCDKLSDKKIQNINQMINEIDIKQKTNK